MKKILIIFNLMWPILSCGQMTASGKQAKDYWSAQLVPEVLSCESGFGNSGSSGSLENITPDQMMQIDVIHEYWFCSTVHAIESKSGRLYNVYQSWRLSHNYHDYIQEESAKYFFANAFALWATAIFMEKTGLIKKDELHNLDKFHIYQFVQKQKSLLKNNFLKKYAQKSLSSAYFKLLKKENVGAINSAVFYGGDIEYLLMAIWMKYQDTATNLLYEETPL